MVIRDSRILVSRPSSTYYTERPWCVTHTHCEKTFRVWFATDEEAYSYADSLVVALVGEGHRYPRPARPGTPPVFKKLVTRMRWWLWWRLDKSYFHFQEWLRPRE